jgi:hypothetical protein
LLRVFSTPPPWPKFKVQLHNLRAACSGLRFMSILSFMRQIAKWLALVFIALVAVSPIFEFFDKTDGFAQDISDLARYALCLFCFLAFALRRTVFTLRLTSFGKWIIGPMDRPAIGAHFSGILPLGTTDRALFLTLHDLRI